MNEIVHSGTLPPGECLTIICRHSHAIRYKVEFGGAGAVQFTISSGGEFKITGGTHEVKIYLEEELPSGVREA